MIIFKKNFNAIICLLHTEYLDVFIVARNCDMVYTTGGLSATIEQFKDVQSNNTCEKNHLFLCLTRTGITIILVMFVGVEMWSGVCIRVWVYDSTGCVVGTWSCRDNSFQKANFTGRFYESLRRFKIWR